MNKLFEYFVIFLTVILAASSAIAQETVKDELVETTLKDKVFENPYMPYKYDFTEIKRIPVELKILEAIDSEQDITEGQTVVFKVCNNVYEDKKIIIPKDELVQAKVETIVTSGMNGIPASIIFGDFKFTNIDRAKITDFYEKYGQDRSLLVFPLKWALTILPPTGSLTNFIKGGHAKLKTGEKIVIYYHPEW